MELKEGIILGEQVGFLDLTKQAVESLVCTDPITDHYHVEMTPFARGKFAAVRRVRCLRTGEYFAAKVVRRRRRARDVRHETLHEAAVLSLARDNPKIVKLHKVFEGPSEITLILELAAGGELQRVVDEEERIEERVVRRYLTHILTALRFLHSHNIAHLDLKPQNLLLTGVHPSSDVKLCDFGISRIISTDIEVREVLGTPDYVAPEILQYEPISLATDMWSVGVLTYVLLTGHSPFGGDTKQETFLNISQCQLDFPDELFASVSSLAKEFMSKLLVVHPESRLTVDEALAHPWLSGAPGQPSSAPLDIEASLTAPLKRSSSPPKTIAFNKENDRNALNGALTATGSSPPSKRECRDATETDADAELGSPRALPPQPTRPKPQGSPAKERGRVSRQIKSIEMKLQREGDGGGGAAAEEALAASLKARVASAAGLKAGCRRSQLSRSFGAVDQPEGGAKPVVRLSPLCLRREQNQPHHQTKYGSRRDFQEIVMRNEFIY